MSNIKVLLVDDDPDDYTLVRELLAGSEGVSFELQWTASYDGAVALLQQQALDVILVDYRLGHRLGTDLIAEARRMEYPAPIILLTGQGDRQVDLEAMRAGAVDYLAKASIDADRLERAIRYAVERGRLEARLREAYRMETVGRLAGGVAHDFNNLLTTIKGNLGLVLADPRLSDPMREEVEAIEQAADRAARVTRELLAFASRQILQPKVVDLNQLLTQSSHLLRVVAGDGVDLTIAAGADPATVRIDPVQIEQALINLVVHCRGTMPDGGSVAIETRNVTTPGNGDLAPGGYLLLSVAHTGTGMDVQSQRLLFEPFSGRAGDETGLGLAMVYGVVRQSEGVVRVRGGPGQGTTFELLFPVVAEPDAAITTPPSATAAVPGTATILVVEDEPAVRLVVEKILRRNGFEVLTAENGVAALEVFERHGGGIDLVLTDVRMPRMGGRELQRRLRELAPGLRVLYMSGFADEEEVRREVGGASFVSKPFGNDALVMRVREALSGPDRAEHHPEAPRSG